MSQNKSETHANDVLNTMRGSARAAWTPYVGLCVGDPRTTGIEASYSGYIRQAVTWGAPNGQFVANSAGIEFPAPAEVLAGAPDWVGIYDAETSGVLRYALPITNPASWVVGQPPLIAAGALVLGEL